MADDHLDDAERPHQIALDEVGRFERGERARKVLENDGGDTRVTHPVQPLAERRQRSGRALRSEHRGRVREEREDHTVAPALGRLAHDAGENLLMADVDAIEVAERGDRGFESGARRLEVSNDLHEARGRA